MSSYVQLCPANDPPFCCFTICWFPLFKVKITIWIIWFVAGIKPSYQLYNCLVVWNMAFIFPFTWECHHPNCYSLIFFRGVGRKTTNQLIIPPFSLPSKLVAGHGRSGHQDALRAQGCQGLQRVGRIAGGVVFSSGHFKKTGG